MSSSCAFFFFNDTATTEIYTLSLHDALPISEPLGKAAGDNRPIWERDVTHRSLRLSTRSEEHTSELQSPCNLVCRLLLEKKKKTEHVYRSLKHRTRTVVSGVCRSG